MSTAHIKNLVEECFRRWDCWLTSMGAERRCALRLDRIADRLQSMDVRINMLRERMEGEIDEPIDEDRLLRESLIALKEDIREIRCQLFGMDKPQLSARLKRAFSRLGRIAEATYGSADKLQWELDEHDSKFAR